MLEQVAELPDGRLSHPGERGHDGAADRPTRVIELRDELVESPRAPLYGLADAFRPPTFGVSECERSE
jgi:hypothetical protein